MQSDAEKHTGLSVGTSFTGNGGGLLLSAATSGSDGLSDGVGSQSSLSGHGLNAIWSQFRANPLLALLVGAIIVLVLFALLAVSVVRSRAELFEHETNQSRSNKSKLFFYLIIFPIIF
jgi:uncharacterized protein (DUF2062 family)